MLSPENIDNSSRSCYTFVEVLTGGGGVTASEQCKKLIERSEMLQKTVAQAMGWTEAGLCNKFRRNSLSADEFMKILDILGYEMQIVSKDTQEEVKLRKTGIGPRLKMMVNGIKYDTYKADAICHTDAEKPSFDEVYRDDEGRYFVAHYVNWDGGISSISPIDKDDVKKLFPEYTQQ